MEAGPRKRREVLKKRSVSFSGEVTEARTGRTWKIGEGEARECGGGGEAQPQAGTRRSANRVHFQGQLRQRGSLRGAGVCLCVLGEGAGC